METWTYIKNLIKDKYVASVTPSSRFAVKNICAKINFMKKNVIVEYGPGTGAISKNILKNMNSSSKLILVETNKNFVKKLRKINDPRVFVFNDCAENIKSILGSCGEDEADYVISGIPFSYFDSKKRDSITKNTMQALNGTGKFVVYQFTNDVKENLETHFSDVKRNFELRNLPPLRIFEAKNH
ncbi:hypothetical protein KY316_01615 [Candidatus Woesearchaeota archaeon]|nr:hypothetical protein [Candidatus Woesearchaeota archaeon]